MTVLAMLFFVLSPLVINLLTMIAAGKHNINSTTQSKQIAMQVPSRLSKDQLLILDMECNRMYENLVCIYYIDICL